MGIDGIAGIGVVGAGQMGRGIAQVACLAGLAVVLHDQEARVVDAALLAIDRNLDRQVGKGSPAQATSRATADTTVALAIKLDKTPVLSQDLPGFISNRILMPMINEAIFALHEGLGTRDDIDTVMTLGMRHPMGPLALADFIGLDTCLSILEILHSGFGDPKYRPCPLLRRMVDAGMAGVRSGRGFYEYDAEGAR